MNLWTCLLLLFMIPQVCVASWVSFEINTSDDGAKTVKATYSNQGKLYTIRSTTEADFETYQSLMFAQFHPFIPEEATHHFFKTRNLKRQKEGQFCHLYALYCEGGLQGYFHVGRKKTIGIKFKDSWFEYDENDLPSIIELWRKLGIVENEIGVDGKTKEDIRRKENRGLALLMPLINPKIAETDKQMFLNLGFEFIKHLKQDGMKLVPEKKINSNEEVMASPHQVVVELYKGDPLMNTFTSCGFNVEFNPCYRGSEFYKECFLYKQITAAGV